MNCLFDRVSCSDRGLLGTAVLDVVIDRCGRAAVVTGLVADSLAGEAGCVAVLLGPR